MRRIGAAALALVMAAGIVACDDDDEDEDSNTYVASLTGAAERPTAVTTNATGSFTMQDDGSQMSFVLTVNNITGPITGAHIHAVPRSGVAAADTTGGIVVNLNPPNNAVTTGILAQGTITQANIQGLGTAAPISMDSLRTLINAGRTYVNVHTQANLAGHIRGTIVRQ
jgi:hypothetical protein